MICLIKYETLFRIARLVAERINTDEKLKIRIAYLEEKLAKYEAVSEESDEASENEKTDDDDGKVVEEFIVPSHKKDV